ncbi:lipopolysaccharide assembly protein LapB [Hasllibacter sp. MH4015]|uniref:tetratricopeptide repeat protein n=1 Tax=Hasllibacter sp. MH4015 TaxID=2854029 RepID=UPI001CD4D44E|nr:hypothetical protein [Hasllibacter sp. MH4015]
MTATFAAADPVETCLYGEGDWAATLSACNTALAATDDPVEQGRFILHRGIAHEFLGDMDAAFLDQILVGEYRPDWFRGYANASSLAAEMGDAEGQMRWAQAAIDAEPDNPRAYLELLIARTDGDDPESCGAVADQIIDRLGPSVDWAFDPSADPYLLGNLGYCLHWAERHEEAMQAYNAADYVGLSEEWFYSDVARLAFYSLEQDDRAVEAATQALAFDDPHIDDVYVLVQANIYLEQFDAARAAEQEYSAVIDQWDHLYNIRNDLAWHLYLRGELEAASDIIDRWYAMFDPQDTSPNDNVAGSLDTLAHIRAAAGDAEGALEAFAGALARDTEEYAQLRRDTYRREMEALGLTVPEGEDGLMAGLAECVAMGAACRLLFDDDSAVIDLQD